MVATVLTPRLKARVLVVLAAMMVAMMGAGTMSNASGSLVSSLLGTEEADAAVAYRQIKGTVYRSDTQRAAPYATVELYYWEKNCVQSTCWTYWKTVRADAYGRYVFTNNPTGHSYYVKAWTNVGGTWYKGNGSSFFLRSDVSTAHTSNVTIRMPSPF